MDWYKVHFKWAWSNEHNISLNGGTEKLQYYVSGNYLNQNGNLRYGNDNLKRYNFTAKVNTQINKYIDFNINTKFIRFDLDNPLYSDMGGLLYHDIARMWPMMPFKDPNGHYMRNGKLAQLTEGGRAKTHNDNIYLQGQLVLHPLKNWNIYVEGGMRIINENQPQASRFMGYAGKSEHKFILSVLPFTKCDSQRRRMADEWCPSYRSRCSGSCQQYVNLGKGLQYQLRT